MTYYTEIGVGRLYLTNFQGIYTHKVCICLYTIPLWNAGMIIMKSFLYIYISIYKSLVHKVKSWDLRSQE